GLAPGAGAPGGVGPATPHAGTRVAVVDGVGRVGAADHTPQEWLDTTSVPQRVAMLADLIVALGAAGTT
ncbi:M20 family peptidase, partial [Streptomyces sp. NPDC057409]